MDHDDPQLLGPKLALCQPVPASQAAEASNLIKGRRRRPHLFRALQMTWGRRPPPFLSFLRRERTRAKKKRIAGFARGLSLSPLCRRSY